MKAQFFKSVNYKSREAMITFLTSHFRYDTMSSWNRATSYANNMKIPRCIPSKYQSKVYELMEAEGFYDTINEDISFWDSEHNHLFQAGFNGRSGGYLVMYEGKKEVAPYITSDKLKEIENGQQVYIADGIGWKSAKEAKKWIGKNKTTISSFPGRGIDMEADFEDWDNNTLKARVQLVQSFDQLCDSIADTVIDMAKNLKVEEETYVVSKTRKVIV